MKLISFLSMLALSLLELSRIKEGDGISIETVQLVIEVDKQVDKSGQHVVDADHFDMSRVPAVTYWLDVKACQLTLKLISLLLKLTSSQGR